ncbi:glycosyltransferase, partial [Pilimelia columellifera]|uniref:glycosyltransferase n=1 Tax=Pilimelia columellifera TaxID=706574 RepID=UPI0031D7A480
TARTLGRRAVISRGWAELSLPDDGTDCIAIGEVNERALFPRVAAVVHHGGSGTTASAARCGVAQVVIPQMYDQYYWAQRVEQLGIGIHHHSDTPTADLAPQLRHDGAHIAAQRLHAFLADGVALTGA